MRIYTRFECYWDATTQKYITDEKNSHWYEYDGPIALCAGGGPSVVQQPATTTTTVQQAEPWDAQKPYLEAGFKQAQDLLLNQTPQLYPDTTITPHSPEYYAALQMTENRALLGSPLQDASTAQLKDTLNGAYLNNPTIQGSFLYGGPGFNAAVKAATDYTLPQINSSFEGAGRYRSGLATEAQTKAIADAFASQYGQERALQEQSFSDERQKQMQAMLFAPSVAQQDYNDISQLAGVGAAKEADAQQALNEQVYRYTYGQNIQQNQLFDYLRAITGNYGSTGTSSGTQQGLSQIVPNGQGNPLLGGLGGALAGGSFFGGAGATGLASMLTSGQGAILGGLLGLVGGFI